MYNAVGEGGRVSPGMIAEAIELEREEYLDDGWAFQRLWEKYDAMVAYRQYADKEPGRSAWVDYQQTRVFIPRIEPQWWMYH
jgi:hypothetical protein